MLFSEGISYLSSELAKTPAEAETLVKLKNSLNFGKIEVGKSAMWRDLLVPNEELVTVGVYETGTASVGENSRAVSFGGGAVVSSSFKGRYIQINNGGIYEITDVNTGANTVSLKSPAQESASGTFQITKRYYRVPSDILMILPDTNTPDHAVPLEIQGQDEYASDYTDGTITIVKDSFVFTGNGTAFFDKVFPGDMIQIDTDVYRVNRVLSDGSILSRNRAKKTVSSAPYRITSDTPYKASINDSSIGKVPGTSFPLIQTGRGVVRYQYIRSLYQMVHPSDTTELPSRFDRAILDFANAEFKRISKLEGYSADFSIAQARVNALALNKDLAFYPYQTLKQNIPYGVRGRRH